MTDNASTTEGIIREIVCAELKIGPELVAPGAVLRELPGIESVKVLRIVSRIERRFGVELDDRVVFRVTTLPELVEAIQAAKGQAAAG